MKLRTQGRTISFLVVEVGRAIIRKQAVIVFFFRNVNMSCKQTIIARFPHLYYVCFVPSVHSFAAFSPIIFSFIWRRGNIRYRTLIEQYKPRYTAASRVDKVRLSQICTLCQPFLALSKLIQVCVTLPAQTRRRNCSYMEESYSSRALSSQG